jgi:hypothetical protein
VLTVLKCVSLNLLEPSGHVQPVLGLVCELRTVLDVFHTKLSEIICDKSKQGNVCWLVSVETKCMSILMNTLCTIISLHQTIV